MATTFVIDDEKGNEQGYMDRHWTGVGEHGSTLQDHGPGPLLSCGETGACERGIWECVNTFLHFFSLLLPFLPFSELSLLFDT